MVTNYYTLKGIAEDLNRRLKGCRLLEAFSQNRNELVLRLQEDLEEADRSDAVLISCEPSANSIFHRASFARARRNSVDFFSPIIGEILEAVMISATDREISFQFSSGRVLIAQFFGSRANVILCDDRRTVLEPFLKTLSPESTLPAARPVSDLTEAAVFAQTLRGSTADATLLAGLKRALPRFGATLHREVAMRSGFSAETPVADLSDRDMEALAATARRIQGSLLLEPQPRIYLRDDVPVEFALIPLEQFGDLRVQLFEDLQTAIRTYLAAGHVQRAFHDQKRAVLQALQQELSKTERTLQKIDHEAPAPEEAAEQERFGKLLTAHLHVLRKGEREALVEDVYTEDHAPVLIPLDVHLTPAKNAERYYARARKLRETIDEQRERRGTLLARLRELEGTLVELDDIENTEALRSFIERHKPLLASAGYRSTAGTRTAPPPPFRVFIVTGGFQVWAGKSSENNDLLTTRHTGKEDLWFHARGVGGSHVVLKVHTGKGEVSRTAVQDAASVAAFFSKMKNASLVPVTMCLGKHVRKPKGAPAGTVMVEREETIFAEPRLPAGRDDEHAR